MNETQQPNATLSARSLTVRFSNGIPNEKTVFKGLNFDVSAGECVILQGASGTGKTTLLRVLARLTPHTEGDILLNGMNSLAIPYTVWRRKVTLIQQSAVMIPGTVLDNVMLGFNFRSSVGERFSKDAALDELKLLGLGYLQAGKPATELSGGEAARVALVRALLIKPQVLLLDEPIANLDKESANLVMNRIVYYISQGGAVIMVSHSDSVVPGSRFIKIEELKGWNGTR